MLEVVNTYRNILTTSHLHKAFVFVTHSRFSTNIETLFDHLKHSLTTVHICQHPRTICHFLKHFVTTWSLPIFSINLWPFCSKPGTHPGWPYYPPSTWLLSLYGTYVGHIGFSRHSALKDLREKVAPLGSSRFWLQAVGQRLIAFLYHLGSGGWEAASHSTPTQIQIKSTSPSRVFPKSCSSRNRPFPKSFWRPILSIFQLHVSECDQKPAT